MIDTSIEMENKMREMIMSLSPGERLKMACDMFESAKTLAIAGITDRYGKLTDIEMRVMLFVRMYGEDFSLEERSKIISYLLTI